MMVHLHGKHDDGGQTDPAVQCVHVVDGLLGQIVRVEHRLESDRRQNESRYHDGGVHDFQFLLSLVAQQAVNQDAC